MVIWLVRAVGNLTNIGLCLISLRSFKYKSPVYARVFSLLCIFEQLAEFVQWRRDGVWLSMGIITSNAVSVGEILVYGYIFFNIIHSRIVKWILSCGLIIYLIMAVKYIIAWGFSRAFNLSFDVFTFVLLLIPAFTYFREIFTYNKTKDLLNDFTFWFVTGTLFYCAAWLIVDFGLGYFYFMKIPDMASQSSLLRYLVFTIVNCIHIKAYLCLKK